MIPATLEKSRWVKVQSFFAIFALPAFFIGLSHFLSFVPEPIGSRAELLVRGAKETLLLTVSAGAIGFILGIVWGLLQLSPQWYLKGPVEGLIWILRGTPLLVQVLFVYFALPAWVPSLELSEWSAAVLALSLNVGAYNAETVRAGILAVPKGQTEAALSLGLSSFQKFRFVILPQAIRIVLPPLVNNLVSLLKDSSLASAIGLFELSLAGNRISSETFKPISVLTTVSFIYLALTTLLTFYAHLLKHYGLPSSFVQRRTG